MEPSSRPLRAWPLDDIATLVQTAAAQRTPHRTRGDSTTLASPPSNLSEPDMLRAAFRDLHGASLHGFAVLLTLGDRSRAATTSARVLAAGSARAAELRHPERAAAWLRARVVRALRRTADSRRHSRTERRAIVRELGVLEASMAALESLTLEDRAALLAGSVERFTLNDVATILGRDLLTAREVLRAARRRYLAAATHWLGDESADAMPGGLIAEQVDRVAARAIGRRATERGA